METALSHCIWCDTLPPFLQCGILYVIHTSSGQQMSRNTHKEHLERKIEYDYIGNLEEGPATMHRNNRLACFLYLPAWRYFWDVCFYLDFSSLFSSKRFLERFFPWACWQHVLNKFVLCWLIPVFECVFLCVVWATCFTCFVSYFDFCMLPDLCTLPSPRFLHVAQSLLLNCNGLSVRCMQSVRAT